MEENNILPGLSVLLLSTLCRPQVVTMLFSCLWTGLYYLPIDPSSLMCSLARVSNFLGTLYNDSALPDLWAFSEQSRNFEWLPCIQLFSPQRLSLHNCQTSTESLATPRTPSPFYPSAADCTKVVKQAEDQLVSTENTSFCVTQVLSDFL